MNIYKVGKDINYDNLFNEYPFNSSVILNDFIRTLVAYFIWKNDEIEEFKVGCIFKSVRTFTVDIIFNNYHITIFCCRNRDDKIILLHDISGGPVYMHKDNLNKKVFLAWEFPEDLYQDPLLRGGENYHGHNSILLDEDMYNWLRLYMNANTLKNFKGY